MSRKFLLFFKIILTPCNQATCTASKLILRGVLPSGEAVQRTFSAICSSHLCDRRPRFCFGILSGILNSFVKISKRGLIVNNEAVTTLDTDGEVRQCWRVGSSRLHETKKSFIPVQGASPRFPARAILNRDFLIRVNARMP